MKPILIPTPHLRIATVADAAAINGIYNHYVRASAATFQTQEETTEEREEELRSRPLNQPVTVLELEGRIVGWGALSPFHSRCAAGQPAPCVEIA